MKQNGQLNLNKYQMNSIYYGTADYYKEKIGENVLDDEQFELLEIQANLSKLYQGIDESHLAYVNNLREQSILNFNRMMDEFKEREEEGKDEIINVGNQGSPTTPPFMENIIRAK